MIATNPSNSGPYSGPRTAYTFSRVSPLRYALLTSSRREMGDARDQLMWRQVDDMLLAVKTEEEYHDFNKTISKEIRMEAKIKLATS